MADSDFYDMLGVDRDADENTIKKAYRKLAMKYHPDRNAGNAAAEVKFKQVNEAYEILKDQQKRAAYDRFGHAAFDGSMGGGQGHDFASSFTDVFDDLFGDFAGAGRRRRGGGTGMQGADLRYDMEITLEEAFTGKRANIRVPTAVSCTACSGTGADGPDATATCGSCSGYGKVRAQQGFFSIERTCPSCGGAGKVIRNPCRPCSGSGRVRKEETLGVTIPAGIQDGMRIRLSGKGEAGVRGGSPGDYYIVVAISAASVLPARGRHHLLPRAHLARFRGTRQRYRDPNHRQQTRQDHHSGGNPDRPAVPPARQGHERDARIGAR